MVSSELWFGASPSFYNGVATQSLRLDDGSGAYLSRTPSDTGNRRKFTWSGWFKRGNITTGVNQIFLSAGTSSVNSTIFYLDGASDIIRWYHLTNSGNQLGRSYSARLRDTSAWYHIMFAVDTEVADSSDTYNDSNRVRLYLNGTELRTTDASYGVIAQNSDLLHVNTAVLHQIGKYANLTNYTDGYLAEVNFVNDAQLTPSSFGETKNGVWIPIKYTGSYGTNGFRLQFEQTGTGTASASTIGADTSGNTHHFTSSGIVASDCNMPDSPENNFSTWNALFTGGEQSSSLAGTATLSNGNLEVSLPTNSYMGNTFRPTSGKWYCEFRVKTIGSTNGEIDWGWLQATTYSSNIAQGNVANKWGAIFYGYAVLNGGIPYIAINDETSQVGGAINVTMQAGDILQLALDIDNNKGFIGRNNAWLYSGNLSGGNPATGANPTFTFTDDEAQNLQWYMANGTSTDVHVANFGQDSTFGGAISAGGNADGNGKGDFAYAPPSGFLALCSANLPEPTISPNADTQADDYFNTVLYTGNATDNTAIAVDFQPDWTWIKKRLSAQEHVLFDSNRGATKRLFSNLTNDESDSATSLKAFTSTGFTLGTDSNVNDNTETFVAWNWKANGTAPTKTYKVKVVSDSTDFGHGTGSNKYQFFKSDGSTGFGTNGVDLDLQEGGTYTFDWSDSSAQSHPIRFSLTNDGTHSSGTSAGSEYTTGVVKNDSAYTTTITVASGVANLYYYCQNHSGMGAEVRTNATFGQTNFDGSILSVSNTNTDAGFSIVTFTGNNTNDATIGHGVQVDGVAKTPAMIITKNRDDSVHWRVWHKDLQSTYAFYLSSDLYSFAPSAHSNGYIKTVGDTTYSTYQANVDSNGVNGASDAMVAYCFAEVEGYSRFGKYIGNGATSGTAGTYVHLGFRPSFVMLKTTGTGSGSWWILDSTRDPFNEALRALQANDPAVETGYSGNFLDFYSNGFAPRTSGTQVNGSGHTYIYMAFAENPFKYANAR